eukprot:580499-Pyramimonas_sp.AAC.1
MNRASPSTSASSSSSNPSLLHSSSSSKSSLADSKLVRKLGEGAKGHATKPLPHVDDSVPEVVDDQVLEDVPDDMGDPVMEDVPEDVPEDIDNPVPEEVNRANRPNRGDGSYVQPVQTIDKMASDEVPIKRSTACPAERKPFHVVLTSQ